jgi:hypothetical protein
LSGRQAVTPKIAVIVIERLNLNWSGQPTSADLEHCASGAEEWLLNISAWTHRVAKRSQVVYEADLITHRSTVALRHAADTLEGPLATKEAQDQ